MIAAGRVLVVDDDDDLRVLLRMILEEGGMHVTEARDGQEALDAIRNGVPDLILLDMCMPRMDGWAFARALDHGGSRPPIVVLTAATDAAERAAEIAADGWLGKPFDIDTVLDLVRSYLAASSPHAGSTLRPHP